MLRLRAAETHPSLIEQLDVERCRNSLAMLRTKCRWPGGFERYYNKEYREGEPREF